jgi:sortase A
VIAVGITATLLALSSPAAPAAGEVYARLSIPAIGLRALAREGVSAAVLDRGPGHYPGTSAPGHGGTVAIAGHRVTRTHPFLRLNELRRGDTISVTYRSRRHDYRVVAMRIVRPTEVWTLGPQRVETLVLTACHPPGRDAHRLVVFARPATYVSSPCVTTQP